MLRLNSDASRNITGLAGGADGRIIVIVNVGAQAIVLVDESVSSTAANRFALSGNTTLAADTGVSLIYDSTSSRWRIFGVGAAGAAQATQAAIEAQTNEDTYIPPDLAKFAPGMAKGFCKVTGSTGALEAGSLNVSSVTRNAAGNWDVFWDVDFSGTTYTVIPIRLQGGGITNGHISAISRAVGSANIRVCDSTGTLEDQDFMVVAFGDQ